MSITRLVQSSMKPVLPVSRPGTDPSLRGCAAPDGVEGDGDLAQGRRLLVEHRAGLELLRLSLAEAGSPWTAVLEAVSATMPPLTGRNEEAVARLIAEGPPEEEVGLAPYGTASGPVFLPDPVLEARS